MTIATAWRAVCPRMVVDIHSLETTAEPFRVNKNSQQTVVSSSAILLKLWDAERVYKLPRNYYGDDGLEINGVNGAIKDWREILLPLLLIEQHGEQFEDQRKSKADTISHRDSWEGKEGDAHEIMRFFALPGVQWSS